MAQKRTWLTVTEAAEKLGVTRQRMHQIVEELHVKTTRINPRLLIIEEEEFERIQEKRSCSR